MFVVLSQLVINSFITSCDKTPCFFLSFKIKLLSQMINTNIKKGGLKMRVTSKQEEEDSRANRQSPFARFYQVNKDKSEYLRSCLQENPKALQILFFIFDNMDNYNALICSYKVFQEQLGLSQATVARCVKYLKEHGFIYVYKTGMSNVYVANKSLVWNSWGNNAKYCKFPANIMLSASEQEKQDMKKVKRIKTISLQ